MQVAESYSIMCECRGVTSNRAIDCKAQGHAPPRSSRNQAADAAFCNPLSCLRLRQGNACATAVISSRPGRSRHCDTGRAGTMPVGRKRGREGKRVKRCEGGCSPLSAASSHCQTATASNTHGHQCEEGRLRAPRGRLGRTASKPRLQTVLVRPNLAGYCDARDSNAAHIPFRRRAESGSIV